MYLITFFRANGLIFLPRNPQMFLLVPWLVVFFFCLSIQGEDFISIESTWCPMDEAHHPTPTQQFFTNENGINYSRYGNNSPWAQISPHHITPITYSRFPVCIIVSSAKHVTHIYL